MTYSEFKIVSIRLKISDNQVAEMLGLSKEIFQSLKPDTLLNVEIAELANALSKVIEAGLQTFDSDEYKFVSWMHMKVPFFNNVRPIVLCKTIAGARLVKEELFRMEHGILS